MKRSAPLLVVAVATALTLTACGGDDEGAPASDVTLQPSTSSAAATSTTAASPSTNARGNIVKVLGQEARIVDLQTKEVEVAFTVDEIIPDIPCTADYTYPAEHGHLVGIKLRVSTGPSATADDFYQFIDSDFRYIGSDGITNSAVSTMSSWSCLNEAERFTSDTLGPGQQYVGTIVLDLPATTGSIVFAPSALGGGGGWEWAF